MTGKEEEEEEGVQFWSLYGHYQALERTKIFNKLCATKGNL